MRAVDKRDGKERGTVKEPTAAVDPPCHTHTHTRAHTKMDRRSAQSRSGVLRWSVSRVCSAVARAKEKERASSLLPRPLFLSLSLPLSLSLSLSPSRSLPLPPLILQHYIDSASHADCFSVLPGRDPCGFSTTSPALLLPPSPPRRPRPAGCAREGGSQRVQGAPGSASSSSARRKDSRTNRSPHSPLLLPLSLSLSFSCAFALSRRFRSSAPSASGHGVVRRARREERRGAHARALLAGGDPDAGLHCAVVPLLHRPDVLQQVAVQGKGCGGGGREGRPAGCGRGAKERRSEGQ